MNVAIHFIDQKVTASVRMPVDVTGMTVHDFITWALENIADQQIQEILAAIRDGHMKWFKYTRSGKTSGALHDLNGLKKKVSSLIVPRRAKNSKITGDIYFSAPYALPCNRCGACCMPRSSKHGFREYLGDLPPADNVYFIRVDGKPCKIKVPQGAGALDFGVPARCAHLSFDIVEGLYGCKIHDKPRGYACMRYECSFMLGELDRWEGTFTKVQNHPICNTCQDRECSACFYFPAQVEWFIAYIRHQKGKEMDRDFIEEMIPHLENYMKKLKTLENNIVTSCMKFDWLDGYLAFLEKLKSSIETGN